VDLPEDESDSTFDGRNGNIDGTDDNTIVIGNPCDSSLLASPNQQNKGTFFQDWLEDNIVIISKQIDFNGDNTAR
jgi:hypothetical protein